MAASIGVREIRRSLATRDVIEARKRALEAYQAIRRVAGDDPSIDSLDVLDGLLQNWRPKHQPVVPVRKPRTIKVGIEHFLRENAHLWTPKTAQEMKAVLGRFCVDQGFGKEGAIAHKASLAKLHPRTQNKHLSRLRRLYDFLRNHGYYAGDNPFAGLEVRVRAVSKVSDSREIWSDEECRRLAEFDHWLLLLGLYTGARINELAQLRLDDVQDCIRISDEGQGQRLKNPSSRRIVPIHPELTRRGFAQHVAARRAEGKTMLFDFDDVGLDGGQVELHTPAVRRALADEARILVVLDQPRQG